MISEQEKRRLILRAGELSALPQHPSWPVLEGVLADKADRIRNSVAVEVLGSEGMTLERQAYLRGFVRGMSYVLLVPTGAEERLERLLRDQPTEGEVASG